MTLFTGTDGDGDFSVYRYNDDTDEMDDDPLFIPDMIVEHLNPERWLFSKVRGGRSFVTCPRGREAAHSDGRQVRVDVNDIPMPVLQRNSESTATVSATPPTESA